MDTNTSTPAVRWKPTTEEWGLAAYAETKAKFDDLVTNCDQPRAQGYALWALSHDPSLAGRELFNFRTSCGNDQPSPEHIERARSALKVTTGNETPAQDSTGPKTPAPKTPAPKTPAPQTPKKRNKASTRRSGRQL